MTESLRSKKNDITLKTLVCYFHFGLKCMHVYYL